MHLRRGITIVIFLALIGLVAMSLSATGSKSKPQTSVDRGAVRILFTKPSIKEIKNLVALHDHAVFQIPGMVFHGVYHENDENNYSRTEQYLQEKGIDWITIEKISCDLNAESIFKRNGCSDEFARLFETSDAAFFNGGPDIPPALYGEPTLATTKISTPGRHIFEISFLHHLLKGTDDAPPLLDARPNYLVLGLCLGAQSMNIALGGTMIQDIPSEVYGVTALEQEQARDRDNVHRDVTPMLDPSKKSWNWTFHPLRFDEAWSRSGLPLPKKEYAPVISVHHQATEKLGDGLYSLAYSPDGKIVEAFGHRRYPNVIGLQFHAEKRKVWFPRLKWRGKNIAFKKRKAMVEFHRALWHDIARRITEEK